MAKVWSRFEGKRKDGSIVKLKIEDLSHDRHQEGFDFMKKYYVQEEAFNVAAGVPKSQEALNEYRELLDTYYKNNPRRGVYCSLDDGTNTSEIIGLSFMQLCEKSGKQTEFFKNLQVKTKELQNMYNILKVLEHNFRTKDYERYYDGRGIIVHPEFRGLGVASEFVKVRKLICIDEQVPVMTAWMTSIGTQKAADKNKWKTLAEISPQELGKISGLEFGSSVPMFKLMYATTNKI